MEETQILPRSLLFRRYITSGPRCFDFYRCPGDLVYVELNVEDSNKLRADMKPPRKPISEGERLEIFDYLLHRGGNPFANLEKAEERLGRGFRILKKIYL